MILEIITKSDLPASLESMADWTRTVSKHYMIYQGKLDYLGDEYIIPLNNAYSTKQIVHWSCEGESAFDYTAYITLN